MTGSTTLDTFLFDSGFDIEDYLVNKRSDISSQSQKFEKIEVLCAIHGHTHNAAPGIEKRKCEILNFGPLYKGRFGFLELEKSKINNNWRISSTQFCNMVTSHIFV